MALDDIGVEVLNAILADADVQAITTRGFTGYLPQFGADLPAFTVDVITNNAIEHLGGSAMAIARITVDAYDVTRTGATDLAETIRQKVLQSSHKGVLGSGVLNVREITIAAGPFWDRDRPVDGSDDWRAFTSTDYLIHYQQTGPS